MATRVDDTYAVRVSQLPAGAHRASRFRESIRPLFGFLPAFLLVTGFVMVPLVWVIAMSFDGDQAMAHYTAFFESTGYRASLANTFEIAITVTVLCIVLGFPFAWCMVHASKRVAGLLIASLMIPLWTSMLVRTYAWIILLNPYGVINQFLMGTGLTTDPLELVHNRFGVLIGMTQILLPFFVLPLYAVMRGFDGRLLRAAKSLGATPAKAFFTVFIPGIMPGLIAGSILVFIIGIGFFITPALLGGGSDRMISQLIEQQFSQTLNWGLGAAMATILLVSTIILLVVAALVTRPRKRGVLK